MKTNIWNSFDGIDSMLSSPFTAGRQSVANGLSFSANSFGSQAEVEYNADEREYTVTMDLPGLSREHIDLSVTDNTLIISSTTDETHEGTHQSSHRYSNLRREVALDGTIAAEDVSASYNNGVLTVILPTAEPVATGIHIPLSEE